MYQYKTKDHNIRNKYNKLNKKTTRKDKNKI